MPELAATSDLFESLDTEGDRKHDTQDGQRDREDGSDRIDRFGCGGLHTSGESSHNSGRSASLKLDPLSNAKCV